MIRTVQVSDIEQLKSFFIKAYGKKTIFQNEQFLTHYFSARLNNKPVFSNSLIGITKNGDIVSHYGGLEYNLKTNHKIYSMVWGVTAYTLPEYRGKGSNSQIIDFIINTNMINGVIGFSSQTALFYQKLGYNIFDFEKFTRHIFILDYEKTLEICNYIKQNSDCLIKQKQIANEILNNSHLGDVIELTTENIGNYNLNLDEDFSGITTTHRTKEFLIWRFLENPFITYSVYGFTKDNFLLAYIALREEILEPFNYKANRIIDLYGKSAVIEILLDKTLKESVSKHDIYIDFSKFGSIYELELESFKFIRLENEDYCVLPQVTSPIENRPNGEFLGILSRTLSDEFKNLSRENVYFTRMDSDRDRLANINQIKESESKYDK